MIKRLYQRYKNKKRAKQVLGLFAVNIAGIPIGIITSIIITRYLGPTSYGDYQFIQNILNLTVIIFSFGFFQAGNRALVLNNNRQKAREYYGAELIITGGLFIIISVFLVLYSLFDKNLQLKQLDSILFFIIPFSWVFLLLNYFETLFQADNRINMLAQVRLFPKIGFMIATLLVYFHFRNIQLNRLVIIWSFYLATEIIVYLLVLFKLNVSFKNFKERINEIWACNKSFGLNVYLGSLFAVGLDKLTGILIGYYAPDNSGVGFYNLALSFAMPLSFIPNTIATTHYKDFSTIKYIPKKLFQITLVLSCSALIGLWLIIGPFIKIFYGLEFSTVINLNFISSIGVLAFGFGDFFNRYLGANGQGKALRNSAIIVGIAILILSLIFIPLYGEYGAAYSKIASGFIYLITMLIYYYKFIRH
ncbi:MAG: oligosaccharide flippase family protein [Candidatus Omnitrophica bacterium]|nr:oligosaccharide flippase family protein [Candidatus Omnitrophota bacterium]